MADPIQEDLNAVIVNAVNARVEAAVTAALSGDETLGRYVTAALASPVSIPDRYGNTSRNTEPFIRKVLREAIQAATEAAVRKLMLTEIDNIEAEVRKALRRDVATIASTLTKSLTDAAATPYGVNIDMSLNMPDKY